jgi:2,4-dichlorophenol 6-monooxygenase
MAHETDILIVGAGPAGLLAAILASQLGLRFEIIEMRAGLHTEPSAHVLKTHSMEVYRRIGIADAIFAQSTPEELQRCIVWCESLSGLCYGRLDLCGKKGLSPRFTNISPVYSANVPQNVLEPLLKARLCDVAGTDPVRFGQRLVDFTQDGDAVSARISDGETTREVRARYILGADGAGSQVRRSAGIAMDGPPALAHFLAIHIQSDMMPILERHPGVVFFLRAPGLSGFFIVHQPVGSQVFMLRIDPGSTPPDSFDEAQCRAIIDQVIGSAHEYTITSIGSWVMSAQIARHYRNGRALLVGDAGHRFPPTGGLGLNTGVEDVENLMWKLNAVIRGKASDRLLDSYEQECRPIAIRNTEQSVRNNERMQIIETALGGDRGDEVLAATLRELQSNGSHPQFAALTAAVNDQIDHFAFLELEMAARLTRGVFADALRPVPTPVERLEGYQPSFAPGGHLPHFWLSPGRSALDTLRFDRFILFVPAGAENEWSVAVDAIAGDYLPVDIVALEGSMRSDQASVADYWGEQPFAMLVRPDGRIAWVEPAGIEDRTAELERVLALISDGEICSAGREQAA